MSASFNLQRFVEAQQGTFDIAVAELRDGAKQSHWMWFIFPQLAGLGRSPTAVTFAISSQAEGSAYLAHPVLGPRLRQCVEVLLPWASRRTAEQILGSIDSLKLRSSLTLFDALEPAGVFASGLGAFFNGVADERTLALLNAEA